MTKNILSNGKRVSGTTKFHWNFSIFQPKSSHFMLAIRSFARSPVHLSQHYEFVIVSMVSIVSPLEQLYFLMLCDNRMCFFFVHSSSPPCQAGEWRANRLTLNCEQCYETKMRTDLIVLNSRIKFASIVVETIRLLDIPFVDVPFSHCGRH